MPSNAVCPRRASRGLSLSGPSPILFLTNPSEPSQRETRGNQYLRPVLISGTLLVSHTRQTSTDVGHLVPLSHEKAPYIHSYEVIGPKPEPQDGKRKKRETACKGKGASPPRVKLALSSCVCSHRPTTLNRHGKQVTNSSHRTNKSNSRQGGYCTPCHGNGD